ncbi:hypothetical protein [Leifsonia xyli]|uniref:hypothetical protein n=1 Tax=Leifsonia xyli TaxID=1575 RepID=UPI003D6676FA
MTALKDAYLDAGGVCEGGFSQDNKVKAARQSGVCGEDVVLSVYKTKADRDGVVSTMRAFEQGFDNPDKILVGPNWIVNSPDIKKVQKTIGGKIVDLGD